MDVLAAYIDWKDDGPGMMVVSSFKVPDPGDLVENDRDVKKWLMKAQAWKPLSSRITINRIRPRKVIFEKSTQTPAEIMAEMMNAARKRELEIANGFYN